MLMGQYSALARCVSLLLFNIVNKVWEMFRFNMYRQYSSDTCRDHDVFCGVIFDKVSTYESRRCISKLYVNRVIE